MQNQKQKLLVLAAVGLLFSIGLAAVLNANRVALYRSDIFLRWYASEKLLSENRKLYDAHNAEEVTTFVHGSTRQTNFHYPAHMLLFTGPVAILPYRTAHLVWTIATQLFYLASLWLTARTVGWSESVDRLTVLRHPAAERRSCVLCCMSIFVSALSARRPVAGPIVVCVRQQISQSIRAELHAGCCD